MAAANRHKRNFLKTLDRGLQVLAAFSPEQPALTLSEMASRLNLDPGTVFRFVYTLEHLGYVRRQPNGAYRLTSRLLDLARPVDAPGEMRAMALPHMEALAVEVEETVSLAVLDGGEIVVLAQVESPKPVTVRSRLGDRQPAYCTAQGKVLLAHLPPTALDSVLQSLDLRAYGARTITSRVALRAELRRTIQRGYAVNNDEMDAGLRALAVPVQGRDGAVAAALSIDVPTGRMSMAELQAGCLAPLSAAAGRISQALGAEVEQP
jgi:IclR family transcriptional regulator, pca regulon regulatory protein